MQCREKHITVCVDCALLIDVKLSMENVSSIANTFAMVRFSAKKLTPVTSNFVIIIDAATILALKDQQYVMEIV